MKKTGIRIVLALILLLVMVLGSVSTVEARGRPAATAAIGQHLNKDGTLPIGPSKFKGPGGNQIFRGLSSLTL